jgi:WD40 repeat protein
MNARSYAGWMIALLLGICTASAQPPARVELAPQTGQTAGVTAIAFRPGVAQVLSASSDGSAILWDAKTGRQLRTYRGGPLSNSFLIIGELQEAKMPPTFPAAARETPAVSAVAFSPDGRWFVMACRPEGFLAAMNANSQAVVWDTESGKRIRVFDLELDSGAIALSRDGKQLLSGGQPMDADEAKEMEEMGVKVRPLTGVVLWDIATGKEIRQYGSYDTAYGAVQFSPDGRYVLGGGQDLRAYSAPPGTPAPAPPPSSVAPPAPPAPAAQAAPGNAPKPPPKRADAEFVSNGVLRLWDAATGKEVLKLQPRGSVTKAAFSPSGKQVLALGLAGTLDVWEIETKKQLLNLRANAGVFSTDGKQVLAIDPAGKVGVWDLAGSKEAGLVTARFEGVKDIAIGPDGRHLLIGMTHLAPPRSSAVAARSFVPGEAVLLDVAANQVVRSYPARTDPVDFVTVSPTGQHLLIGDNLWDTATGQKLGSLCSGPAQAFSAVFSTDGKRVLVANHRGSHWLGSLVGGLFGPPAAEPLATLVDVATGKELAKYEARSPVSDRVALGLSVDGTRALMAARNGSITVWDVATGKRLSESLIACNNLAAAFSPDGKLAAVSFHENRSIWWDCEKGEKVSEQGHQKGQPMRPGTPSVSSRDGKLQLAFSDDGLTVIVQDPVNKAAARALKAGLTPYEGVRAAGFDAQDERFVFAEISSPCAGLWNVDAGKRLREFSLDEPFTAEAMAFGPDGRCVATAGNDGQMVIWDVATGKKASAFKLDSPIIAVTFSQDGNMLAAGCADRTAVVLRIATGEKTRLLGHEGPVDTATFRPDGKLLVTACREDGTARIWDMATGKELARIVSIQNRRDWLVFTPEGSYDGSEGGRALVAFRVGDGLDVQPLGASHPPQSGLLGTIWGGK